MITENKLDLARQLFQQGLTTPTAMMHLERPQLLVGTAYVNMLEDQVDLAAENLDEADHYINERRMKHFTPMVSFAKGKLNHTQGQLSVALDQFSQAEEAAQEMQMLPIVWQARAKTAELMKEMNQPDAAKEKNIQALKTIGEIKELFENQELRNVFIRNADQQLQDVS